MHLDTRYITKYMNLKKSKRSIFWNREGNIYIAPMQDLRTWWWAIFIRRSTGGTACSRPVLLHQQQEPVQASPVLRRRPCWRRRRRRIVGGVACGVRRLFSRQRPRSGTGGRARRDDHESQQHGGHHCGLPHHGLGGATPTSLSRAIRVGFFFWKWFDRSYQITRLGQH